MFDRAWTSSADELLELQLLEWSHAETRGSMIPAFRDFVGSRGFDPESVKEAVQTLLAEGLIRVPEQSVSGLLDDGPQLTDAGQREIRRLQERRRDRARRAVACREAFLNWLYEQKRDGNPSPNSLDFLDAPQAHFLGVPFEDRDVHDATLHLGEKNLLTGDRTLGAGIIRPTITADGELAVERGGSLVASAPHIQQNITTNFTGPVSGQVAIGERIDQTQNLGVDPGELDELLRAVREASTTLPAADAERLSAYADAVQAEALDSQPDGSLVQRVGDRMLKIADTASNEAVKVAVQALVAAVS